jgi:hypothetical protein
MALNLSPGDELMADLTDVLDTVTTLINGVVYPNGTLNPSIVGVTVTINPGWPIRNVIDDTLRAGNAMISVFPDEKETIGPIFERTQIAEAQSAQTIFATVSTNTITITGTVTLPQAIVTIVNGISYGYALQMGDTTSTIATNIAALLPSASAIGNVITVSDFYLLETRVSTAYSSALDLGRQYRTIMMSVWSPTPDIRHTLGAAIDVYFKTNYRILLPDNFWANVFYLHTREVDLLEKQDIYRRDLLYRFLYATTSTETDMTFVWPIEMNTL